MFEFEGREEERGREDEKGDCPANRSLDLTLSPKVERRDLGAEKIKFLKILCNSAFYR